MPIVTLSEAAKVLNFRSRSALYRLKAAGDLAAYLRPPASTGGAQLLELSPRGLPPLREHVHRQIRQQANNEARHNRARVDPRWAELAGALSEALEGCGGLKLSPEEAQSIAQALPEAVWQSWGDGGLEWLRQLLVAAGGWWAGPPAPTEATAEHWREDGRWEPTAEPPEGDELWGHVAGILGAQLIGMEGCTARQAVSVWVVTTEAIRDVLAGARWDQERWDRSETEMYLGDEPGAADTAAWLRERLEAGRLPPDLAERARAWLATPAAGPEAA